MDVSRGVVRKGKVMVEVLLQHTTLIHNLIIYFIGYLQSKFSASVQTISLAAIQ